ncbi:hypothetical protein [Streptomyces sp. NRRL F-5755]|uniref:hypothetical protein n=1 Tax=Streptomyces sp. NRRL F-5755 TaxID=1519475 RepID=UPI0013315F8C|nr:hypothetical protein [Streptomyces sp. NRRL F-5755]
MVDQRLGHPEPAAQTAGCDDGGSRSGVGLGGEHDSGEADRVGLAAQGRVVEQGAYRTT